jgi:hypothetical protein
MDHHQAPSTISASTASLSYSTATTNNFSYSDSQTTKDKTHLHLTGTMATTRDAKIKNDEIIPQTNGKKKRLWSDAEFLRQLREGGENRHFGGRMEYFFGTPLNMKADLPLPEYKTEFSHPADRAEQLQDICNKATVTYSTDSNTWGIPLYQYIFRQLRFTPFFACFPQKAATLPSRNEHNRPAALETVSYEYKFSKNKKIKKILRNGWIPQNLEVQEVISENEVVVLLPEAVRFIMDLDKKEEALQVEFSSYLPSSVKLRAASKWYGYLSAFDLQNPLTFQILANQICVKNKIKNSRISLARP